jgi:hypothetical protein
MAFCVYCGGDTKTRDHVPSRVFLDEPYPLNLPVVPACQRCNEKFSLDEEYLACMIECVLAGAPRVEDIRRDKIRQILAKKPALVSRLAQARSQTGDGVVFAVEVARVRNIVMKLARGHAAYELHEPRYDEEPLSVSFVPIGVMSRDARLRFDAQPRSPVPALWPEVGSRAMQRILLGADMDAKGWVIAQPGRYRYRAWVGDGMFVRMVLSEYLACEVVWD